MKIKPVKPKMHFTPPYFLDPLHPISILIIGIGGTGSKLLTMMPAIHLSLKALGHPGIFVTAIDSDIVTEANRGRQMFYESDLEQGKAEVLISRINRSFGFDWEAYNSKYEDVKPVENRRDGKPHHLTANIIITCVDTVAARKRIGKIIKDTVKKIQTDYINPYYWIDTGNGKDYGQVIMGTLKKVPAKNDMYEPVQTLINVLPMLKGKKDLPEDLEPSCSTAEALERQSLFINTRIATETADMIYKLFKHGMLNYRGVYINAENLQTNPIKL